MTDPAERGGSAAQSGVLVDVLDEVSRAEDDNTAPVTFKASAVTVGNPGVDVATIDLARCVRGLGDPGWVLRSNEPCP